MSAIFSTLNTNLQNIESPKVYNNILLAHLVFKCLVKIAVWLWNKIDKLPRGEVEKNALWVCFVLVRFICCSTDRPIQLQDLFRSSVIQLQSLADLRHTIVFAFAQNGQLEPLSSSMSIGVLTRHIRLFGKFFRRLQQLSHARFVELPTCADLVLFYWSKVVDATSGPREYVAGALHIYNSQKGYKYSVTRFRQCSLSYTIPGAGDGFVQGMPCSVGTNPEGWHG